MLYMLHCTPLPFHYHFHHVFTRESPTFHAVTPTAPHHTALSDFTSSHTEQDPSSFAQKRPQPHNSRNLYPVQVAFNFWDPGTGSHWLDSDKPKHRGIQGFDESQTMRQEITICEVEIRIYKMSPLTSTRTSILAIKTKVMLKASSSKRDRGRQPSLLHFSTAGGVKGKVEQPAAPTLSYCNRLHRELQSTFCKIAFSITLTE